MCHGHREGRIANTRGHDANVITSLCNDRWKDYSLVTSLPTEAARSFQSES